MNKDSHKITSLESLRGLLALWVTIGHIVKHAGFTENELGVFKLLANPGLAVDCFIILSGFVIFMLLDTQRPTYGDFIVRRFFRLAPLYFVVIVVSTLSLGWQANIIANMPWKNAAIVNDLRLHMDALRYLPQHLFAHATMLHGLLADSILPGSQYAIVGQAWSISVEWQFYLIAPGLFLLMSRQHWRALAGALILLCVLRAANYGGEGFAVNQAAYFLIGILSYLVYKKQDLLGKQDFRLLEVCILVVMTIAYLTMSRTVSIILWGVIILAAVAERHPAPSILPTYIVRVLRLPVLQWLGKISYSMYMLHMLVLYLWFSQLLRVAPDISKSHFLTYAVALIVPTTIALSAISYRFVESPGMQLARSRIGIGWLLKSNRM